MFLNAKSSARLATSIPTKAGVLCALASYSAADISERTLLPLTRLALS